MRCIQLALAETPAIRGRVFRRVETYRGVSTLTLPQSRQGSTQSGQRGVWVMAQGYAGVMNIALHPVAEVESLRPSQDNHPRATNEGAGYHP